MFTSTDSSKKKFLENTRIEREKRENERLDKIQLDKRIKAAIIIQHGWRKRLIARQAQIETWKWWHSQVEKKKEFDILDFLQWIGLYCFLTRKQQQQQEEEEEELKMIVKYLTINKFRRNNNNNNNNKIPYYTLLIDMRFMERATRYLQIIIQQSIHYIITRTNKEGGGSEMITFLLQYLNPKTYSTKHVLDNHHVIDLSDKILISNAQSILKSTLCSSSSTFNIQKALIQCVEQIVKLQDRSTTHDMSKVKALKLWLTTITRLTLYPIENAELTLDSLDMKTASRFLLLNTLSVPCIVSLINPIMVNRLRPWAFNLLLLQQQTLLVDPDLVEQLGGGNGLLFLLANLVNLCWKKEEQEVEIQQQSLIETIRVFLNYIEPWFSDRQTSIYTNYHPIFKWSKTTTVHHEKVFNQVMKQLEYIWSRSFMDQVFQDIILFNNHNNSQQNNKGLWFKKQQQQYSSSSSSSVVIGISNEGGGGGGGGGENMALFSIEVESIFSMYIQLTKLFKAHRKIIFYRIAFTYQLMPQLWKLMNQFGPKGNMIIYLDAAASKSKKEIDKEPLVQVLKVFCEACSIVFLTLDDVDIFQHQKPFSPSDLIQISAFLNSFYFALIQQQTDISSELPSAADSFKSARRLLLQIYDLDLHHPFCPPNHWLLISQMSKGVKSFFTSFFNKLDDGGVPSSNSSTNKSSPSASLFLSNLRQGDPVPLRILQLMPHTVSFDMRLKIFREWIALDRLGIINKTNAKIITVRRGQVLEDGYHGLAGLAPSAWKGTIRVSFVNEVGAVEAGIDQVGPFKDFITMLIQEAFEPNYGLFSSTKLNSFYPSATSSVHGRNHIQLFEFIGKTIGKALYEGILLDVKFTGFLLARLLGRNVFLEELKELDEEVWKNLTFIKHYEGDVEDLGLSFEANEDNFGKIESHELKYRGRDTAVTNSNKVEYVYLMADHKLNQRAKEQTKAFIHGFRTVISESWIKLFSPPELQRVLSGEDTDFDISDLRRHTEYQDGYFDLHPVIRTLWQIVGDFSSAEKRSFLKFATGCPKPPLGGFEYLQPPFTIRLVSTDAASSPTASAEGSANKLVKSFFKLNVNKPGRLPSSATCFNLLKLPAYTKKSLLKEKLLYAINSNAGFELS